MHGKVRPYVDADLHFLRNWIERQKASDEPTFWMNWNWIEKHKNSRKLRVYELPDEPGPIAYMLGDLHDENSLLEVENRYRRQGIGRRFASHAIDEASRGSNPLLLVQATFDSAEFWRSLGFEEADPMIVGHRRDLMVQKLRISRPLPAASDRHMAVIDFFSGHHRAEDFISTKHALAVEVSETELAFEAVVAEYDPRYFGQSEMLFFRVSLDSRVLIPAMRCDTTQALELGVVETDPGYSFDRLHVNLRDIHQA